MVCLSSRHGIAYTNLPHVTEDANKACLPEEFHGGSRALEVPVLVASFFLRHSKVAGLYSSCSSCQMIQKTQNKTAFSSSTRSCLSPLFQFFYFNFL